MTKITLEDGLYSLTGWTGSHWLTSSEVGVVPKGTARCIHGKLFYAAVVYTRKCFFSHRSDCYWNPVKDSSQAEYLKFRASL